MPKKVIIFELIFGKKTEKPRNLQPSLPPSNETNYIEE